MARFRQSFLVRTVFGLLARVLALLVVLDLLACLVPVDFSSIPYLSVLVAGTPWFILVGLLALVLALLSSKWFTALLMIICLAVNISWQYPFYSGEGDLPDRALKAVTAESPDRADDTARVMTMNVYKGRADADAIVKAVRDNRVEVLALQETTAPFLDRLHQAGILKYLPYEQTASADKKYGNGLWTAAPMESPAKDDVNSVASQMPAGYVPFSGGRTRVRFVSVHTTSPTKGYWSMWKRSLGEVGNLKGHQDTRYVLLGDFNATWDHAPFRDLLGDRFQDAARQAGHGMTPTWPADRTGVPRLVAIDHIVVDKGIRAGQLKTLKIAGSDHDALLGTLVVD